MSIIGHKKQWEFLKKSFELKRVPHAFLFQGPEKLGKRTIALEFIKLVNCQDKGSTVRPCQQCLSCKEIKRGTHPDFISVESLKKEIRISQIRELGIKLASKPSLGSFKSAIIDKAHLMTTEAQSCFLKTLEEPKGKTLLILITEYPERLLSTILSRVQKIKFYPVQREEIENYLISQGLQENRAKELAILSFGKPGLATEFLLTPTRLEDQRQKIKELVKICNSPLAFRFQYVKAMSLEPDNLKESLEIWLRYFRNLLIKMINSRSTTFDSKKYSLTKLRKIIQSVQNTIFYISTTNVNPKLALEALFLEL
jgi:DNA polymerase-3 subunit delta'